MITLPIGSGNQIEEKPPRRHRLSPEKCANRTNANYDYTCPGVGNLQRAGLVQRIGKGIKGNPYLYFAGDK